MAISFARNHIGKSLDEGITADDLINYFIQEQEESLTLEFKCHFTKDKPNYEGVVRTIAAFLNSEGGLLVWGAPIPIPGRNSKYKIVKGALTPVPAAITSKDSLISRLSGNIAYMPIGIRVEPVLMHDGGFVYLIEVRESVNKPHQYNN